MVSAISGGEEPAKQILAKRVASEVLKCDATIRGIVVVDENAKLLATASSDQNEGISKIDYRSLENFAALVKLFIEAAKTASPEFGGMQFIIGAFRGGTVLLMDLAEYRLSLGVYLVRSANAETIYYKIKDTLASEP
jgi:hypothetical protein